jgi:hypothetical protein
MSTSRDTEAPALFLVGSFPPQVPAEQLVNMDDVTILEDTMEHVFDVAAPYFRGSAPTTESTKSQVDWAIDYAKNVLPNQPGVRRYPGPHSAHSLLSSPHFYLKDGYDQLPVVNDLGLKIYDNAGLGIAPFQQVAAEHGKPDLLCKIDVPEVAMSLVYFGLSSAINGAKRMAVHGLAEAIRQRSARGFATTFAESVQTFEDKYRRPYQEATFNQIDKILADKHLRGKVELQISAPVSHGLTNLLELAHDKHLVSTSFRDKVVRYLVSTVVETLEHIPPEVPRVVHACRGEINPAKFMGMVYHPSQKRDWSSRASVRYANEIMRQTSEDHRPHLIHAAITPAGAAILATNDGERIFEPFQHWPKDTRLAAGMIDVRADAERNAKSYRQLGEYLGYVPDVALACGSGRQRVEVAGRGWENTAMQGLLLSRDTLALLRGSE